MPFKLGQVANPHGRPKKPADPRSEIMQEMSKKHRGDIKKVGKMIFKEALSGKPWAMKEVAKYFFPVPGTFVSVSREETKEINVMVNTFTNALTHEEQQTFLKLWMKSKKGVQAFSEPMVEPEIIESDPS